MNAFQLHALPHQAFTQLFHLSDDELAARGALRVVADSHPGFPCRVSLTDAAIGAELLLLPFVHQPADGPYRASGPIFVARDARTAVLAPGEIPSSISSRLLSVRGYDAAHQMLDAEVIDGLHLRAEIERQFTHPEIRYLHVHNARRGCYACRVERWDG
ncbi:MAG: DUF1203 domain-containing protein [Lysobacterales bacterium]